MQSAYEILPVYKSALDMVIYFEKIVRFFDKYNKYQIGTELRALSFEILSLVAEANTKQVRQECLEEAIKLLKRLKIKIHVCKELKAFHSFNSFEYSTKLVVSVLKQCEGWMRSQSLSKGTI
jgi:hypothetical protein